MSNSLQKHIFPSGLRLLNISMPATRSVTALIMVGAGSRYETKKTNGLSHFLEHMVFKGTAKYPTSKSITTAVDSIGAEFNAFTGKEYTGFYIKAASQHLSFILEMLSQLVFHPILPAGEMEKERGAIIEEINMYEDHPMSKVGRIYEKLLYGDTPLGWDTIGSKQNIKSLQIKDFKTYMDIWYQPKNMVVGISGNAGKNNLEKLVAKYFTNKVSLYRGETPKGLTFSQKKPAIKVEYKKSEQAHLCIGVRSFARGTKYRYPSALLANILGGNMSSRLFDEVREKRGLAYYVRTSNEYYLDNGYLVTQAGTDIKKVFDTVNIIKSQYGKIASIRHSLTEKELEKAKQYVKGKLILALEDSKEMAELYTEDQLLEGRVRTPAQILKAVDQVTLEQVLAVARQIFTPKNLNLAVIGPYKEKEISKFKKLLL